MDTFLSRALLTMMIGGVGIATYWLFNRWLLFRLKNRTVNSDLAVRIGLPSLLYFTTPSCAPCRTIQRPAIHRLQEKIGDQLHVIEVDAFLRPEVASQWGILSVPTTIVLDAQGTPRFVNHGIAPTEKLYQQIIDVS